MFTSAQETFYNSLFDANPRDITGLDSKRFQRGFFRSLYHALYHTLGLPAEVKAAQRKFLMKETVNLMIKPWVNAYEKSKASSYAKLSAASRAKLQIGTDAFYAEIQMRLEIAVNAHVTAEENEEDEKQCLQMRFDLKEKLEEIGGSLFIFVYDELITAASQLWWGLSGCDHAIKSRLTQFFAEEVQEKRLTFNNAPEMISEFFLSFGFNPDMVRTFKLNYTLKLLNYRGLFDGEIAKLRAEIFPNQEQLNAYTAQVDKLSIALLRGSYLTEAPAVDEDFLEALSKPRKSKKAGKAKKSSGVSAAVEVSLSKSDETEATGGTSAAADASSIMAATTTTILSHSPMIAAKKVADTVAASDDPAAAGAGSIGTVRADNRGTIAEESSDKSEAFEPITYKAGAYHVVNPRGRKLVVAGNRMVTLHRHAEFAHPMGGLDLVYDSGEDAEKRRMDVIPIESSQTRGRLFAYIPPALEESLSETQRKKFGEQVRLGRVAQKTEREFFVAELDGDNRLAAKRNELIRSRDGQYSLALFDTPGRHTGSGKSTLFKGTKPRM